MKEMSIHNWFKNQMKKRYGIRYIHIKSPPGIYSSRRGISDFIMSVDGYFVAVEVKVPGEDPTLIQQQFLNVVANTGGLGICLRGKDESIFDTIDEWIKSKNK